MSSFAQMPKEAKKELNHMRKEQEKTFRTIDFWKDGRGESFLTDVFAQQSAINDEIPNNRHPERRAGARLGYCTFRLDANLQGYENVITRQLCMPKDELNVAVELTKRYPVRHDQEKTYSVAPMAQRIYAYIRGDESCQFTDSKNEIWGCPQDFYGPAMKNREHTFHAIVIQLRCAAKTIAQKRYACSSQKMARLLEIRCHQIGFPIPYIISDEDKNRNILNIIWPTEALSDGKGRYGRAMWSCVTQAIANDICLPVCELNDRTEKWHIDNRSLQSDYMFRMPNTWNKAAGKYTRMQTTWSKERLKYTALCDKYGISSKMIQNEMKEQGDQQFFSPVQDVSSLAQTRANESEALDIAFTEVLKKYELSNRFTGRQKQYCVYFLTSALLPLVQKGNLWKQNIINTLNSMGFCGAQTNILVNNAIRNDYRWSYEQVCRRFFCCSKNSTEAERHQIEKELSDFRTSYFFEIDKREGFDCREIFYAGKIQNYTRKRIAYQRNADLQIRKDKACLLFLAGNPLKVIAQKTGFSVTGLKGNKKKESGLFAWMKESKNRVIGFLEKKNNSNTKAEMFHFEKEVGPICAAKMSSYPLSGEMAQKIVENAKHEICIRDTILKTPKCESFLTIDCLQTKWASGNFSKNYYNSLGSQLLDVSNSTPKEYDAEPAEAEQLTEAAMLPGKQKLGKVPFAAELNCMSRFAKYTKPVMQETEHLVQKKCKQLVQSLHQKLNSATIESMYFGRTCDAIIGLTAPDIVDDILDDVFLQVAKDGGYTAIHNVQWYAIRATCYQQVMRYMLHANFGVQKNILKDAFYEKCDHYVAIGNLWRKHRLLISKLKKTEP